VSVGLWSAPAVLVALFAILWLATWLERLVAPKLEQLVAPINVDAVPTLPESVVTAFVDAAAPPGSPAPDGHLGAVLGQAPA
jgi:hypothetical protein